MWGLFVGAAAAVARTHRARGPGPAQDGHRVGGLRRQRRLRRGRRRLRERIGDVDRVEVRPGGVERPGRRRAGCSRRVVQRGLRQLGPAVCHRQLPGQRGAELRSECRQRQLRLLVVLARILGLVGLRQQRPERAVGVQPGQRRGGAGGSNSTNRTTRATRRLAVSPSYAQICNASTEVPPAQIVRPPAPTTPTTTPTAAPAPSTTPTTARTGAGSGAGSTTPHRAEHAVEAGHGRADDHDDDGVGADDHHAGHQRVERDGSTGSHGSSDAHRSRRRQRGRSRGAPAAARRAISSRSS